MDMSQNSCAENIIRKVYYYARTCMKHQSSSSGTSPECLHVTLHTVEVVDSDSVVHTACDEPAACVVYIHTRKSLCMAAA